MPSASEGPRRFVGAVRQPPLHEGGAVGAGLPLPTATTETIERLLIAAATRLRAAGVGDPRLEAILLLAHVLGATQADLLAHPERPVDPAATRRFAALIARRAGREPYAYVVGRREFYGERFVVDSRVLIPRPETEMLVEQALSAIERLRGRGRARPLVVDVGTGSGAIACTIACYAPSARIVATDVSADALAVAQINCRRLGLQGRVALLRGDLLDWLLRPADVIVANLPYLHTASIAELEPEVACFEPRRALDGGPDGTDLIRHLLNHGRHLVSSGGTVLLELEAEQLQIVRPLATWGSTSAIEDLSGLPRILRIDVP